MRELTAIEREELAQRGCIAEDWSNVRVSDSFTPSQLFACRLGGVVEIEENARAFNSTVINYRLCEGSLVDSVARLECDSKSSFGSGVKVASLNENGGRTIKIFDSLTAPVAYIYTLYRHRGQLISQLDSMVDAIAAAKQSTMGSVGRNSSIVGARIIRNVMIGEGVKIEGATILSNATLLNDSYIGGDVKAEDFIAAEGSQIDNAATIKRCFVGENVIISNNFTAIDSLFFASSHLENGEASSIFAGPYTVSHHKSSLLIAGMFSFFNAGSGSNQSNHLFKCGAIHQGVHLRGCKFGSSAYVMLPAVDGAYTSVIGSHSSHHDTSDFPFSYLIVKDGRSTIIPASNLSSYGYMRDIEKWAKRDGRRVKREKINFEQHNPYITSMMISAVNTSNILKEKHPEAQSYVHKNAVISANNLNRGLTLYNKAIVASLGEMLRCNDHSRAGEGQGVWVDAAGQYITKEALEAILVGIEQGSITSFDQINNKLRSFAESYAAFAFDYALGVLTQLLGRTPSAEDIQQTISSAEKTSEELRALALRDKQRDLSASMSISYGMDSDSEEQRMEDFKAVQGLS